MQLANDEQSLRDFFKWHGIDQVECLFADITGYPRGKLMPAESFATGAELRIAQAIPMQAVTGEYSCDPLFPDADPDVRLVPDYVSLRVAPWSSSPRAMVIHDCVELNGDVCQFSARSILRKVMDAYREHGLTAVVAPEIEFYLTAVNTDPRDPLTPPVARGGRAEAGQSAYSLNMLNELAPFWDEFRLALDQLGINSDTWIHESGLSQYEINLVHGDAMDVADQAFLFKYAAKEIALKHGLNAVFMAKPIAGQPGNSMHIHQSVVDGEGQNIFSNPDGSESARFRHFIGGLQRYIPEMMPVFAPFVNSYRRFVAGTQAPVNLHWGYDNRTAGLRIPISGPAARRVENRIAGADANPYLAIAATLAAGLAGIKESLSPTGEASGNCADLSHELAHDFASANKKMADSAAVRQLLGAEFVAGFTAVKALEYADFMAEISAWERRYLLPQA
jgi:glutamine synthetase